MKRFSGFITNPRGLLVLGVLILVFLFASLRPGLQSRSEPYPAPLEGGYPAPQATWTFPPLPTEFPPGYVPMMDGATLTPSPNPCEIVYVEPFPTLTPWPIAKTVNLAERFPDNEKHIVIVQRGESLFEKYIIPSTYPGDINVLLELRPNDIIISGYSFIPELGATPFLIFPDLNPTSTPIIISDVYDLATSIPHEQKCVFTIRRASGIHDQILIPIDAWENKDELLQLNPGDTIVDVLPWIITLTPLP